MENLEQHVESPRLDRKVLQKKRDYPSKRGGLFKTIGATRGKPSHFKRGIPETLPVRIQKLITVGGK